METIHTGGAAVVLLSGGLDSSVLLHYVARVLGRAPLHALSFDYGQRHAKELECARWQADAVDAAVYRNIDVTFLGDMVKGASALVTGGKSVPDLDTLSGAQLDQPPTYVPNRNMILLSIAAAYAESHGIHEVYYGAQALDEYGYWDCTTEFLRRVNGALALNRRDPVAVHAPFIDKKKVESVRLGIELGVNFVYTWSCYRGGSKACGKCPTCIERLNAFAEAGVEDPVRYEDAG
ncbi:MAG: 7-cyano-7-deazaguanine synthase QueC [Candidatus Hydrogenedentes bacterium]|nr:7-cyano-7-deazaguanine synthase QueC [Candidatus Hydrogenedentota bacterium]